MDELNKFYNSYKIQIKVAMMIIVLVGAMLKINTITLPFIILLSSTLLIDRMGMSFVKSVIVSSAVASVTIGVLSYFF